MNDSILASAAGPPFGARHHRYLAAARRRQHRRQARLMVRVVVMLALLAAVLVACGFVVCSGLCCGQDDAARNQAYEIVKSVQLFEQQTGRRLHSLEELTHPTSARPAVMQAMPRDPWGNEYAVVRPSLRNTSGIDIVSAGKDSRFFTDDDIGNWP